MKTFEVFFKDGKSRQIKAFELEKTTPSGVIYRPTEQKDDWRFLLFTKDEIAKIDIINDEI